MISRRTFVAGTLVAPAVSARAQASRIVVTGHLGNIGSRIAARVAPGFVGIDKKEGAFYDLAEANPWQRLIEAADIVVHLAAKADMNASVAEVRRDNLVATTNLLAACARLGVPHLIYASSVGAEPTLYGFPEEARRNAYCRSKLYGEELLRTAALHGLINITAIRIGAAPPEKQECKQGTWPIDICVTTEDLVAVFSSAIRNVQPGYTMIEMVGQKRIMREPS